MFVYELCLVEVCVLFVLYCVDWPDFVCVDACACVCDDLPLCVMCSVI